jgi:hypothetical protein
MAESYTQDEYGYEDEPEVSEEEVIDWLDGELSTFEKSIGRTLTLPEVEALAEGTLAQAEAGHEVDVSKTFAKLHPDGDPLTDTRDQLSEAIEDAREEQEEHPDEDEGDDYDEPEAA